MTRIIYDYQNGGGTVYPIGWGSNTGSNAETVVRLPPNASERRSIISLHEFAHVAQWDILGFTQGNYHAHELFFEAMAWAMALQWVRPECHSRALYRAVDRLGTYVDDQQRVPCAYDSIEHYLFRHISRIERMWRRE